MAGVSTAFDKHILIITPGFPEDENDTACLPFMQVFLRELVQHVRKVSVISVHYPYTNQNYAWENVSVYPLNGANKKWKRLLSISQKMDTVFKQIDREEKVDLIHTFWLQECAVLGHRLAKKYQRSVLLNAVGQDVLPEHNRYLKKVQSWKHPTTCFSDFQKMKLEAVGYRDVKTVKWGHEELLPVRSKSIDLVFAGNLTNLKNPKYYIDICEKVAKNRPSLQAVLIGDGPLRKELEALIRHKELKGKVEILGQLPYAETLRKIGESRVLIHPSNYEGFGMVLVEALAMGTHVFSAPVGIAFTEELMHTMTCNLEEDSSKVLELLAEENAPVKSYPIKETVAEIIELYKGLSTRIQGKGEASFWKRFFRREGL